MHGTFLFSGENFPPKKNSKENFFSTLLKLTMLSFGNGDNGLKLFLLFGKVFKERVELEFF